jgi:lycopene cyclase domain-containing protein
MSIFIPWDIYFTKIGVWSFNDKFIIGSKFYLLPIEEWLFFIIIPFCCVFIFEVLKYFFPNNLINIKSYYYKLLAIVILCFAIYYKNELYTLSVFSFTSLMLYISSLAGNKFINDLFRTFLVSLIPFFLVNGFLTGSYSEAIVIYNSYEIINFRILNIPIEDFFYSFSMISLTLIVYNSLMNRFEN